MENEEIEVIETVEGEETVDVEEIMETVSTGDASPYDADTLEAILAELQTANEMQTTIYNEVHTSITEKTMDSLTFSEFLVLGIFFLIVADFALTHIGGIFKCMK